jgi:hypothetical protein
MLARSCTGIKKDSYKAIKLCSYLKSILSVRDELVELTGSQLLLVDGFQYLPPASYRRFGETLTLTQLQEHFGLLEFLFVLL